MVTPQWLLDSCEKGELMPENDYLPSSDRDDKYESIQSSFDDKKKTINSNLSTPSLTRQGTGSFNIDQTIFVRFLFLFKYFTHIFFLLATRMTPLVFVEPLVLTFPRLRLFPNMLSRHFLCSNVTQMCHVHRSLTNV